MTRGKIRLAVIFVQYDRHKYTLAIEKLLAVLVRMRSVELDVVVVDNAHPGHWYHEVSANLTHIGGDNSGWEFTGFDRGLEFLTRCRRRADVYAFATDAFTAYGEDYLALVDTATLDHCLGLEGCIGWLDSFGRQLAVLGYTFEHWMRTSLFFVPAAVLNRLGPLTTSIEPAQIFGPSPSQPFRDSAPVSPDLRGLLLAWLTTAPTDIQLSEAWHSQFDLDESTFELFRNKVSAILREQLLSARLQAHGVASYDYRLVDRLKRASIPPGLVSKLEKEEWQWAGWRTAEVTQQPCFNIERFSAPKMVVHGDSKELRLEGWVVTEPQVREISLKFSDGPTLGGYCEIAREDVLASHPEFSNELCGFEIRSPLDTLAPGRYELEWAVPGTDLSEKIGRIHVAPRSNFVSERFFIPDSAYLGQPIPISLEGQLECSYPLRAMRVAWDGQEPVLTPRWVEKARLPNGVLKYRILVAGDLPYEAEAPQHTLELEFEFENGWTSTWKHFQTLTSAQTRPHRLLKREITDYDPQQGAVSLHLKGGVFSTSAGESVVLLRENEVILEEPFASPSAVPAIKWFEIQKKLTSIPPGAWEFALAVKPAGDEQFEIFCRWQDQVGLLEPIVVTEDLDVTLPPHSQAGYTLNLAGWVKNHFLVSHLSVKVDDQELAILPLDQPREDVADYFGHSLIRKQGFRAAIELDLPPGEHKIKLLAVQDEGPPGVWTQSVTLPESASTGFLINSDDLDNLDRGIERTFLYSVTLRGEVVTEFVDVVATLFVDEQLGDQQLISSRQPFELTFTPETAGTYTIRVLFVARGRTLYDSGMLPIEFAHVALPPETSIALEKFLEAFGIRRRLGLGIMADHLVRTLLERENEDTPEFLEMLREISETIDQPSVSLANIEATPSQIDEVQDQDRLKVLFVSWEVPCLRHGGGVWMANLLKHLSRRHDITLVHGYSFGEKLWVEDVRPYVSKVVSILKQSGEHYGDRRIPSYIHNDYTPDLRAVIEAEVRSGNYDIVDYEYTRMYKYVSAVDIPQVLTIFEEGFLARLLTFSQTIASDYEKIEHLRDLIKEFYFRAIMLPKTFDHFITTTLEDAGTLSHYTPDSRFFVNTIGVDLERFDSIEDKVAESHDPAPQLIFLGNYRHPPNVDAVAFLVEKVMPEVRRRCPNAECLILGAYPTARIESYADREGVKIAGFVEDYRPYFRQAAAFVAPIFTGAGMRVKVLEAMACATPVIGTELSVNGIGAVDGKHFFRAETATQFIDSACQCLESPIYSKRIGDNGNRLIKAKHGFEAKARERETAWRRVIRDWEDRRRTTQQPQLSIVRDVSDSIGEAN